MENDILFRKYSINQLLGRGSFAKVYHARNIRTNQSVAIKVINKEKLIEPGNNMMMMSYIEREITIMGRLRHPNIIRLYEVLACKRKIYLVLELAKGGELFAKTTKGRLSEELTRKYFQQLISAVGYCHFRGVYHRNLSINNILLDEKGSLKLIDFSFGAIKDYILRSKLLTTMCGTPAYVAPEMISNSPYDGSTVDVWSCGVILFTLAAGYTPFDNTNLTSMYKKIYKGEYNCPNWMSPDLTRLLGRLLEHNPKTRITIGEIIEDPWFRNGGLFKEKVLKFAEFPFYYGDELTVQTTTRAPQQEFLNAFDLIALSPGLNLSGMLNQTDYNSFEEGENFVSSLPVYKIISTIEEVSRELKLKFFIRKKNCVVVLIDPMGNFIVRVEISKLTQNLVIVEVKVKGGDSIGENIMWKNKLMSKLSRLMDASVCVRNIVIDFD